MSDFAIFVETTKKNQRIANLNEAKEAAKKKAAWLVKKVKNHCERYDYYFSYETVLEEIQRNDLVASAFAKDPTKQNVSETLCASYIGYKKMDPDGPKCVRFDANGDITSLNVGSASKSSDFYINGRYYTQKYTGQNTGGAQDNQYRDVVDFLNKGSIKHQVGAIVDGWYWEEHGNMEKLKQLFKNNPNIHICSADEVKKIEL